MTFAMRQFFRRIDDSNNAQGLKHTWPSKDTAISEKESSASRASLGRLASEPSVTTAALVIHRIPNKCECYINDTLRAARYSRQGSRRGTRYLQTGAGRRETKISVRRAHRNSTQSSKCPLRLFFVYTLCTFTSHVSPRGGGRAFLSSP